MLYVFSPVVQIMASVVRGQWGGGGDTIACGSGGGGSPFGRGDRHCGTLDIYVLCGRGYEGNTEEDSNGYVVLKWNIHGSAGNI